MNRKIKVFSNFARGKKDSESIEEEVNEWLGQNPDAMVLNMVQSESSVHSDEGKGGINTTITLFYEEQ